MKRILLLLLLLSGGGAFAQDPIYGLGICTSGSYERWPSVSPDPSHTENSVAKAVDSSFGAFLLQFEEGLNRFVNGDPTLWQRHTWQGEDATLMGEWGAYERGGRQVDPRYDWASARFSASGAKVRVEYLSREVSENLA
ncbi:MAG: hypothetical protein H7Z75_02040, partial [Ferruginibacter sp.]|nr:hypothetical protein [Cytophagales bacterium]